ncbi:MAG: Inositol-1-monophosphatase, partial [uncultured Thermomicrobiales bacterium]
LNGQPLRVSTIDEIIRGLLCTGFPYDAANRPVALAHWEAFTYAAQAVRRNGAAALDLCNVAAGRFDGFYEAHLGPWDCGAGALIVAEAGGRVSDYAGGPFARSSPRTAAYMTPCWPLCAPSPRRDPRRPSNPLGHRRGRDRSLILTRAPTETEESAGTRRGARADPWQTPCDRWDRGGARPAGGRAEGIYLPRRRLRRPGHEGSRTPADG